MFVRELHNQMASLPEESGLKEVRYADNNIIISDSTLQNILPTQLKNMTSRYRVMCWGECFVSTKSMHSSLLSWVERFSKKLKDQSCNAQERRSG